MASTVPTSNMRHTHVQEAIAGVQEAAQRDLTGTGQGHADLVEAVQKLNLAVESPPETLMRLRFEPIQSAATRMALEVGVLDAIAERKGAAVTAQELGEITGYDSLLIRRIMRQVTWCGVCDEVGEAAYAANDTTGHIVSPGGRGGLKHCFDLFSPIAARLMDYLHQTKIHQFPKAGQKTAFEYVHGAPLWDYMQKVPESRKAFDDYMAARREGIQRWYETYPIMTELCPDTRGDPDAVLLVDVGGNFGHEAASFHATYPNHAGKLILQDLPTMIGTVKEQGIPPGVEPMAYNFFDPQPVEGARAYYFRSVCHDWDDASCEKFLTNTAGAMEPGYSRMLIDEYVLPEMGAPIRGSSLDILMMLYCGGIERTQLQWESLLERCGLKIVKIWAGRGDYESIIEAMVKS